MSFMSEAKSQSTTREPSAIDIRGTESPLPRVPPSTRPAPESPSRHLRPQPLYQSAPPPPYSSTSPSNLWGPRPLNSNHDRISTSRGRPPRAKSSNSWSSFSSLEDQDTKRKMMSPWSAFASDDIEPVKWKLARRRDTFDIRELCRECNLRNIRAYFEESRYWTLRKKAVVFGSIGGVLLIMIIIIAAASSRSSGSSQGSTSEHLSSIHVTNSGAFSSGGASQDNPTDAQEGAEGKDEYTYYSGTAEHFPSNSKWVAFDGMWEDNLSIIRESCTSLGYGDNDSESDLSIMRDAIEDIAAASLVDQRFILATVMQESHGCVSVGSTTSSGGVTNPGLMQSHNGSSYSPSQPKRSIYQMIHDGTQGTAYGDGLVQLLNKYGNAYMAARGYNSGSIAPSGDLSDANGATACYVSDIANRLTGWVHAPTKCFAS